MQTNILNTDTICAVATPHGMGAIAVVRVSGPKAISIVSQLFTQNGKPFDMGNMVANKAYYGHIVDHGELLDEVLVTFFKRPPTLSRAKTRRKSACMARLFRPTRTTSSPHSLKAAAWLKLASSPDVPSSTVNFDLAQDRSHC
jgi:Predicted GTPase